MTYRTEKLPESCTRYIRVDRRDLAYLKFIVEAYEGLAVLSTVEREGAVVKLTAPAALAPDLDLLLVALAREIGLSGILPPPSPGGIYEGTCHA